MARSAARAPVLAIYGAIGLAAFLQLRPAAFVSSTARPLGAAGCRSRSRVLRAASKAEIDAAEKHAKLVQWAAKKAEEEGMPQAGMMKAKAEQAFMALEALKEAGGADAPALKQPAPAPTPANPAAVPAMAAALTTDPVMVEEIAELEKQVKLLTWAAKTAAAKGMPQAPAAQVRADQAVAKLMQLKAQQEAQQGGRSVTSTPVTSATPTPVAVAPPPVVGAVTKEEVAAAEKKMQLAVWASKKATEEGMPQAPMMQAKADEAVRALTALKEAFEQQESSKPPVMPAAAPAAAPAPAAPAASAAPSHEEIEEVKKEMKLLQWAAKTAAEQGMPQADMMKGKAEAKTQEYERMMQLVEAAR